MQKEEKGLVAEYQGASSSIRNRETSLNTQREMQKYQ